MKKRFLSFALAMTIVFSCVMVLSAPQTALAAGDLPANIYMEKGIMIHKSDGTLWWLFKTWDEGYVYRSLKVADSVKQYVGDGYILKNDGALWRCDFLTPNNSQKIADNVRSAALGPDSTLILLYVKNDNTLWGKGEKQFIGVPGAKVDEYGRVIDFTKIMDGVADVHFGRQADGSYYSVILKTDSSLWLRNYEAFGTQDGIGLTLFSGPWKLLDDVASITHNAPLLALKKDGSLWEIMDSWTHNWTHDDTTSINLTGGQQRDYYTGELDESQTNSIWIKKPVKQLEDVVDFSGNIYANAGVKKDGSLWTWGDNQYGILGDGNSISDYPERIMQSPVKAKIEDVYKVAFGSDAGLAVKKDGSVWGWGNDTMWRAFGFEYKQGALIRNDSPPEGQIVSITTPVKLADSIDALIAMYKPYGSSIEYVGLETASAWAKGDISKAIAKGIVPDDLQSNYTKNITRGEFCRMAVRLIEMKTGKSIDAYLAEKGLSINSGAFTDTQDKSILAANALNIVTGIGGNKFNPNGEITREQAATMLMRVSASFGYDMSNWGDASFYADSNKFSSWAVDGIAYAANAGIMGGIGDNKFDPQGKYTREQAIVTMLRMSIEIN